MRNILIIKDGIVVDVIEHEGDWSHTLYNQQPFDTACDDHSKIFKVGDTYTIEKLQEYNKELWLQSGWIQESSISKTTELVNGAVVEKITTRI